MSHALAPDGARIHYEIHSAEQDRSLTPVVLVQGLGLSSRFWFELPRDLANDPHRPRTTIIFDNRGTGRSDRPKGILRPSRMADDVVAVLDACELQELLAGIAEDTPVTLAVGRGGPAVLPAMRERKDGLVINVSSWAGVFHPRFTGAAYNGSKHAVTAMTETINMEEGVNGIRACALCPGEVATPILDRRPVPPSAEDRARMVQAGDVGHTIRFLAELPPHVCINQLIISPTWNRMYVDNL